MNYLELTFTTDSTIDPEAVYDILSAELGEIGFESFVQQDGNLLAYIAEPLFDEGKLNSKLTAFPLPEVTFTYDRKLVKDRDWNEEWEKNYFKPIRIAHRAIIRASFHPAEEGYEHEIIIDPKMAFGTGNHETTYLIVEQILDDDFTGKTVLDMGCGTAILAILAKQKGAGRTIAIDIDPWATENAKENCTLNQVDDIEVRLGGAEQIHARETFDIIFANINRNILLADIPTYARHMHPSSRIYLSGFYQEDVPVLESACNTQGLSRVDMHVRNNWTMLVFRK